MAAPGESPTGRLIVEMSYEDFLKAMSAPVRRHDDAIDAMKWWMDESTAIQQMSEVPAIYQTEREAFTRTLKEMGITPPKHAISTRGWNRFMTYAMKRARSDHPHNAKWRPLLATYKALMVAQELIK